MTPRIAVLIGVWNGAPYLDAQLRSLAEQTQPPTHILLSDDGSTDTSQEIIADFAAGFAGDVVQLQGPQEGLAANYLHLIRHCPPCDMVAFCDQDDVWLPDKLAYQWGRVQTCDSAAFHGATTWRTDAHLQRRKVSTFRTVKPSLNHALVQNLAGANTMALNSAGLALAQAAAHRVSRVAFHDWWLYQLFTATGAQILYEDHPQVLYRQHSQNAVGDNQSRHALWARLRQVSGKRYQSWIDTQLAALAAVEELCTPQANALVGAFRTMRTAPPWHRLTGVARLGLTRHGTAGQIALHAAALAGRL